jgi:CRP/FNR family cyclic AMP-dependent transcriptional regulator
MSFAESLGKTQLFSGLSQAELERIAALGEQRVFQRGDMILSEGDTSRELFIVGGGTVEIYLQTAQTSTPLINLGVGQIFGEMTLVDLGARSATVRATDDETVLQVIPHDAFRQLCEEDNHIGYIVMRNLAAEMSLRLRHYNISRAMDAAT